MLQLPLFAIGTAFLVSSCATRYATLPQESGPAPDPDSLLKAMSSRLATTKQYRFTASNTIPKEVAKTLHQLPKNDVDGVYYRPATYQG